MDIEGMEKVEGKVCTRCGEWKLLDEYNKFKHSKDGRKTICRKCQKEYQKQWRGNNPEYDKQWYQNNKEHEKEKVRQYYEENKEHIIEQNKQYYQNNKENNLQYITNMLEQINPRFKELELPVYGMIYKVTNIRTKHTYTGQTKLGLTLRYGSNIIKGWIEERKEKTNQKFLDELIEEDLIIEVIDIGCCRYHLDKMEAYYIDKYDSYNNGYNNNAGYYSTNDGLEEFNKILSQYNIEFIDGEIKEKRLPKQA